MSNIERMMKSECRKRSKPALRHLSIRLFRHSCFVILMFVCFVGPLKFQAADVFDVRCLPCTKQRDEDGKAHRDFRRCDGYDEKDKHLRVVIGQAAWTDSESRKGNEGQVCRIKHQLQ